MAADQLSLETWRLRPEDVRNGSFVQRDPSRGDVKVDESIFDGFEPGIRGGRSTRKLLLAAAVERRPVIQGASHVSLAAFLQANIEPGSHVITDGWSAYPAATPGRYDHTGIPMPASGLPAHEVLPGFHHMFSLVKGR
ncbi:transposase [Cryobacterium sp. 10I1]|uniref:transposase n=1 Tax=unclassified Cryobacterium TaxID=2649013 RepID=UPI002AB44901|nr:MULTISPECIES: transposase [unclassified Cryobacterium]MDY7544413.1 transposase [Cryobacterium sp. 5B3]MEB0000897.1 transposase [Cryobacterium sp. RTS3]MEB0267875.1 transposase [Cryobacterium sp. 10I5]MEB0275518.1 transposase [Cryobacterium sp. 5B3]MEB0288530.1 transposase [Cryobacterium sp. 10S3]